MNFAAQTAYVRPRAAFQDGHNKQQHLDQEKTQRAGGKKQLRVATHRLEHIFPSLAEHDIE